MTETATAEATPEAPAFNPATDLDEFGRMAFDKITSSINEANAKLAQVKAASGDPQALLESLRDSYTEDETVNKIRAAIEKIDDDREKLFVKRDEILKPIVAAQVEQAKGGTEGVEAEAKALLATINAGKKYIKDLYGDAAVAALPNIVGKRAGGGGNAGSGQRRIRGFDVWVDGVLATSKNGNNEQVSNLAAAAKQIGVTTEDAREAFWAAAGTDDSSKYPATVEFTMSVDVKGEGDAVTRKTYNLVCKRVQAEAPRATETAAADASA